MIRHLCLAVACCALVAAADAGDANSWLFRRSYYSHNPPRPVTIARRNIAGTPQFTRPQGDYISSGYRFSRNTINVRGLTVDQYYQYDGWIQHGSQY